MNVKTNNGLDVWLGKQFETNKVSNYSMIMIIRISSVNYNEIVNGRKHNKDREGFFTLLAIFVYTPTNHVTILTSIYGFLHDLHLLTVLFLGDMTAATVFSPVVAKDTNIA